MKDKVIQSVCEDLINRSNIGVKKYNTTLDQNKGDLKYWIRHAYEECLDQANYLKRTLMELEKKTVKGEGDE